MTDNEYRGDAAPPAEPTLGEAHPFSYVGEDECGYCSLPREHPIHWHAAPAALTPAPPAEPKLREQAMREGQNLCVTLAAKINDERAPVFATLWAAWCAGYDAAPAAEPTDDLHDAALAIYMAGYWRSKGVNQRHAKAMWERLRNALGLPEGTASAAKVAAAEPVAQQPPPCPRCAGPHRREDCQAQPVAAQQPEAPQADELVARLREQADFIGDWTEQDSASGALMREAAARIRALEARAEELWRLFAASRERERALLASAKEAESALSNVGDETAMGLYPDFWGMLKDLRAVIAESERPTRQHENPVRALRREIQRLEQIRSTLHDACAHYEQRLRAAEPAVERLREALRGVIREADRNTDPFIRARALLATPDSAASPTKIVKA